MPWYEEMAIWDRCCKKSRYWYLRHFRYRPLEVIQRCRKEGWGEDLLRDHRITKAKNLIKKRIRVYCAKDSCRYGRKDHRITKAQVLSSRKSKRRL